MMKVKYSPQVNTNDTLSYTFGNDRVLILLNDIEEIFDFGSLPDGKAETIESDVFEFCPVLSAERKEGILYLELLNFIGFDATEEERFPEWQEVKLDGKD